ncbi:hypothetical protein [Thermoproteus tenax]|uniref:Uncharacterized protein n=1 Tax=Thermoproteus tenax (strain ATCC 35583 / DSM 2078 / JCM 9277 / NBRC 100435 / Kra 1) TaxID=768679 RepID=G4RLW5_THETK|nr:hypothetical protein [Thermoproteus tenax]CCC82560.1 hypothetical protein TTX_1945 [Thermoproteus tenax Kra 1]
MAEWSSRFIRDANRLFGLPEGELKDFMEVMAKGDAERLEEWTRRNNVEEGDFLVLSAMYILYKTEERVSGILEGLELKADEAIALAGSLMAQLVNGMEAENRGAIMAQILLTAALQIDDKEIREKIAEIARNFI